MGTLANSEDSDVMSQKSFDNLFDLTTIIRLIIYMIRRVVCANNTGAD